MNEVKSETVETTSSRFLKIAIWAVVISLLLLFGWGLVNNSGTRPVVGETAPGFQVQFFDGYEWQAAPDGRTASLADMQGNVVVLNFWASWCVECRVEAPQLESLWRQYRDRGVVFLGVAYVDTEPKSLAFLQEYATTYPNGPDLRSEISKAYEITAVPETFVIDQNGVIADVHIGPINEERLAAVLADLTQ